MIATLRIAACFVLFASGVALGADRQEKRDVSGFTAISLRAPVDVDVVQGDTEGLVLEGDPEYISRIETVVENGTLRIRYISRDRVWNMARIRAHIQAKTVQGLSIEGAGNITSPSLHSQGLHVSIAGSGDVRIGTLAAESLDVSISGSGDVSVAGRADHTHISIAGSGDYKAAHLESREARVSVAGSGDATLWARDSVQVSVMGSGGVRYYGDPVVKTSVMGSGSVKRLAAAPGG